MVTKLIEKQLEAYILILIEEVTKMSGKSKKMNKKGGNLGGGKEDWEWSQI